MRLDLRESAAKATATEIGNNGGLTWAAACDAWNPESERVLIDRWRLGKAALAFR